jgi:hypothetical protein
VSPTPDVVYAPSERWPRPYPPGADPGRASAEGLTSAEGLAGHRRSKIQRYLALATAVAAAAAGEDHQGRVRERPAFALLRLRAINTEIMTKRMLGPAFDLLATNRIADTLLSPCLCEVAGATADGRLGAGSERTLDARKVTAQPPQERWGVASGSSRPSGSNSRERR